MTEIARRGFPLNPLVFGVFYCAASGEVREVTEDLANLEAGDRQATQAEIHDIARRRLFGDGNGAVERMLAQFELILTMVGEKLAQPVGAELESAVKSLVGEIGGQEIPARVREALIGVVRSARAVTARDQSVVAGVRKGVDEIAALKQELDRARKERDMAIVEARSDQLTGVANRRAFNETMKTILENRDVRGRPTSLMMLDIDRFKNVNDLYGHDFGDEVLRTVAQRAEEALGASGKFFRLGGEEFCIVLDGVSMLEARKIGERIRLAVSGRMIPENVASGPQVKTTISCGVTEKRIHDSLESFLHRADKCLYKAKELGRDRVVAIA